MDSSVLETRQLVIMVYDKDQFSSDDVIGCVLIPLHTLSIDSVLDAWLPIVPPPMTGQGWNWRKLLHSGLIYQTAQAELKLKVTARERNPGAALLEIEASQVGGWNEPIADIVTVHVIPQADESCIEVAK